MKLLMKIMGYGFLGIVGGVLLLYATFLAIMTVTENNWLVDEPFHESIDSSSTNPHQLVLLDVGIESLAYRMALIEEAKETLELEFFIYELDQASRVVTQALVRKAKEGVKIRILVDFSFAVFQLAPAYASLLSEAGIQVKYYNTSSVARFFTVQHRTHRKLLLADDHHAVIGGRNIADDYFDLSDHYNFLDSDVGIRGDIVSTVRESFDLYWNSNWALDPPAPDENTDRDERIELFLTESPDDLRVKALLDAIDLNSLATTTCNSTRFVTDYPGQSVNYRKIYRAIVEVLRVANQKVIAESPYFILRPDGVEAIKSVTERQVEVSILTNSLGSTDAYYTIAASYPGLKPLAHKNFKLMAFNGLALEGTSAINEAATSWGVHAKRAVIDEKISLIGTYNIDPRSANLNSELLLICYDGREFAQQLQSSILTRMAHSHVVIDGEHVEPEKILGDAEFSDIMLMYAVMPIAKFFDFLL
jgi:putative cardiolipin synthase